VCVYIYIYIYIYIYMLSVLVSRNAVNIFTASFSAHAHTRFKVLWKAGSANKMNKLFLGD